MLHIGVVSLVFLIQCGCVDLLLRSRVVCICNVIIIVVLHNLCVYLIFNRVVTFSECCHLIKTFNIRVIHFICFIPLLYMQFTVLVYQISSDCYINLTFFNEESKTVMYF